MRPGALAWYAFSKLVHRDAQPTVFSIVALTMVVVARAEAQDSTASLSPGWLGAAAPLVAPIPDACPTFRWQPGADVLRWELTVRRLDPATGGGEAPVVRTQRLPGAVTEWTPALPDCLDRVGVYAWSIRAERSDAATVESEPRRFRVTPEALLRSSQLRLAQPIVESDDPIYRDDFEGGLCWWSGASPAVDCSVASLVVEVDPDFLTGGAGVPGCDDDGSTTSPFPVGVVVPMRATATFSSGGSRDVTDEVDWSADPANVGTVDSNGLYRGLDAGSVTLEASWGGALGSIDLHNDFTTLLSIEVTPDDGWQIPLAWRRSFEVEGQFADADTCNLTRAVTWETEPAFRASAAAGNGWIEATDDEAQAGTLAVIATVETQYLPLIVPVDVEIVDVTSGTVGGPCVLGLDVLQTGLSLPVGRETLLGVEVLLSTGAVLPAPRGDVAWESSDPGVAQAVADPDLDGLATVTASALGAAHLTASYVGPDACEGAPDLQDSAWVTTTPAIDRVLSLSIEGPSTLALPSGWTQASTALAEYELAGTVDVTELATWGTTNTYYAEVDDDTQKGLLTAVRPGQTLLFASLDGVVATQSVIVEDACIEAVDIVVNEVLGPAAVPMDVPLLVRVAATYSTGFQGNLVPPFGEADLVSDDPSRVAVPSPPYSDDVGYTYTKPPGEGGSPGLVTLSVSVDDAQGACPGFDPVTDTFELTVDSSTLSTIAVSPVDTSVPVGLSLAFQAVGTYTPGPAQFLITRRVSWSVDDTNVADIVNVIDDPFNGAATGLDQGTTAVTAMRGAVSGFATLTVGPPVPVFLDVQCDGDPLSGGFGAGKAPAGVRFPCTATAYSSDGTQDDVTALAAWSTAGAPGFAEVDAEGVVTTLMPGNATVVAMFGGGLSGSDNVTVNDATLQSIELLDLAGGGPTLQLEVGAQNAYQARGTFSDGMLAAVYDVTSLAAWSSTMPSIATVGDTAVDKGVVDALAVGSTTIEAEHLAVTEGIVVTVVAPP